MVAGLELVLLLWLDCKLELQGREEGKTGGLVAWMNG
jgi:hypothetical protein